MISPKYFLSVCNLIIIFCQLGWQVAQLFPPLVSSITGPSKVCVPHTSTVGKLVNVVPETWQQFNCSSKPGPSKVCLPHTSTLGELLNIVPETWLQFNWSSKPGPSKVCVLQNSTVWKLLNLVPETWLQFNCTSKPGPRKCVCHLPQQWENC